MYSQNDLKNKLTGMFDKDIAENLSRNLMNADKRLAPYIEGWLNGREMNLTFGDISMSYIMEKESCNYLEALIRMNILMKDKEYRESYKSINFMRE